MSQITSTLQNLPDDWLDQVRSQAESAGWLDNGSPLPLREGLPVLRNVLGELRDAESQTLTEQLPKVLQTTLQQRLANIYSYGQQMIAGADQVQPFCDQVDALHLDIWNGGFRYRGKKVVGYDAKYLEISKLAKEGDEARAKAMEIASLRNQLEAAITEAKRLAQEAVTQQQEGAKLAATTAKQLTDEVAVLNQQAGTSAAAITTALSTANQTLTEVQANAEAIKTRLAEATEQASTAESKAVSATTYDKRLQDFLAKVDDNEQRLTAAVANATTGLAETKTKAEDFQSETALKVDELVGRMLLVEKDINSKLSEATGITLFGQFEKRGKDIKAHWYWFAIAAAILGGVVWAGAGILQVTKVADVAFFLKIGLSIPAALLIGFSLQQYSRERRVKEEYAFKSAISLSLDAYRKLVEETVSGLGPDQQAKFAEFLISSITTIYESPTDKVFGEPRHRLPTDSKVIGSMLEYAQKLKDLSKP